MSNRIIVTSKLTKFREVGNLSPSKRTNHDPLSQFDQDVEISIGNPALSLRDKITSALQVVVSCFPPTLFWTQLKIWPNIGLWFRFQVVARTKHSPQLKVVVICMCQSEKALMRRTYQSEKRTMMCRYWNHQALQETVLRTRPYMERNSTSVMFTFDSWP